MFGDHALLDGYPDGAAADADGGVWSCVLSAGKLARFLSGALDRVIDLPMANPSDATFGGPDLRRLFLTSIAVPDEGVAPAAEAGWLIALDDLDVTGQPEARFRLVE